jgi:hypothetical protein
MKIEFGNLEIGEKFFDEYSGDYWVKIGEDTESDVSDGVDNFELNEIVIVEN